MTSKKWVFRELIKDENDYQGLLAYTCYKIEKDKLAQDLREANKSDEELEKALEQFHNASVTKGQLEEFKKKGLGVMTALTEVLDEGLISKHNGEIQTLKNQHQSALKQKDIAHTKILEQAVKVAKSETKKEILAKMQAYPLVKTSKLTKIAKWILNGFQSVVAVFILIFALHALAYWSSDDATKSGVVSSFWGRVQNMFNSPIPSSEVSSKPTNVNPS
ncbi:hypothetical protein OD218_004573 [Salmonella enterica]|uniref:Uncharacterized protein n=2 Tax=Salmonella enterica TaxID=28901 RepID=A0A7Z1Q444_SALET|nr:hypothetical protein [Salmonella enterica]EAA2775601.1 hypothetical protein [Salmonella enterica subsp. diarizonae]EDW6120947.1 hypothetical protein [Salmonella enterica subsp. salamae]HCM1875175.1 hypothetical protein [Salmonella enterica subsp. diarizonae serovar 53:z10:z35]AXC71742.1 hypothetical protein DOE59_09160 [Salmonella enterica subsp. diarizonae serovar 48:i:z]EAA4453712.1 hypothetical protein [Salmonella enterica subsp. diarizonae]